MAERQADTLSIELRQEMGNCAEVPPICKNTHATVNVQLGDLPLMSNSDVKLAMDCKSLVGFLCTVQWK